MIYLINRMLTDFEAGISAQDIQYFYFGMPYSLSKQVLDKGILIVQPVSTDIKPITTGLRDEEMKSVKIIIAKSVLNDNYMNAQKETGIQYLIRVIEGKNEDNSLKTDTVRYVIRNKYRTWGVNQQQMTINYDTNELATAAQGVVTATIMLSVRDIVTQSIS